MKITILIDDVSNIPNLKSEHGFSMFIEENKTKILFDTGASGGFIENSQTLGVKPEYSDFILLSHNHSDHTGGIPELKKILQTKAQLIIGKKFCSTKYKQINGEVKIISNEFINELFLSKYFEIKYADEMLKLTDDFSVISLKNGESILKKYFYIKDEAGNYIEDNFEEEIILVFKQESNLTVISGCSHTGIEHIIDRTLKFFPDCKIKNIIGGLHLEKVEDVYFDYLMEKLKKMNIKIFAGHCTGKNRLKQMSGILEIKFEKIETGKSIIIKNES